MFLIQWKGYLAEEDLWLPEWDLKHAKSALNDYKTLHPSVFTSQPTLPTKQSSHVPLQTHSRGHPSNTDFATLVTAIEDTHLAIPIDSYLDVESPYYERLHFVHTSVPDTPEFHLAWCVASMVHQWVCDSLLITMFQLGMLEFFQDMDRYLQELARIPPPAPRVPTLPAIPPPIIPTPEEAPSTPT
ncbi:hypothetical protein OG21DRAFT_1489985 [Imleria badia]|nr:hypothetical protein OG21DRAFT_1489985 [Imleria badia]